jgi:hypothetical protein
MKLIHTSLLALIILSVNAFSQNKVLDLKNKTNNKERIVKEGRKIKVFTVWGTTYKGRLDIISSDAIALQQDTIAIDEIARIRAKSTGAKVAGGLTTGLGAALFSGGIVVLVETFSQNVFIITVLGLVVGGAMITYGAILIPTGILILTIGKKYSRDKWDFQIVQYAPPG